MHYASSQARLGELIVKFRENCDKKGTRSVYEYVMTWLTGKFKKWKIFHNPPGWSNTNSNIESFNAVIKRDFTLRRRYSVYASVEMMEDIILYYSTNPKKFNTTPKFCAKMVKEAKRCARNKYKKKGKLLVSYKDKWLLNLDTRT